MFNLQQSNGESLSQTGQRQRFDRASQRRERALARDPDAVHAQRGVDVEVVLPFCVLGLDAHPRFRCRLRGAGLCVDGRGRDAICSVMG